VATVLVVDDEPDVLLLLKIILESDGFDVRTAADGFEAMAICAEVRIDVVITDLMMPRMDGGELIRQIRSTEGLAAIPIIVVSARPDGVDGADAVIAKPFSSQDLIARTRALADAND